MVILSVSEYVHGLVNGESLLDFLAQADDDDSNEQGGSNKSIYPPHWSMIDIRNALKVGSFKLLNLAQSMPYFTQICELLGSITTTFKKKIQHFIFFKHNLLFIR